MTTATPTTTADVNWHGRSGYPTTGEAAARHAEAAADLIKREDWDPQLYGRVSGRQVRDALIHTIDDGLGDEDTFHISEQLLEAVLRVSTGAEYVDYEIWSSHPRTTLADVLAALDAAAALARASGPTTSPTVSEAADVRQ